MPYSMYDNGRQMAGEGAGWLGAKYDPILMRTPAGEPYGGVSRYDDPALNLKLNLEKERISDRLTLLEQLDQSLGQKVGDSTAYEKLDHYRQMAADMLLGSPVREAYDLELEDQRIRDMYGDHIGGQSLLLAPCPCMHSPLAASKHPPPAPTTETFPPHHLVAAPPTR